jgi:phosphate transport system permease protein
LRGDARRMRTSVGSASPPKGQRQPSKARHTGEPQQWCLGGALLLGLAMIAGFILLVIWNGLGAFFPKRVEVLELADGTRLAGEIFRKERIKVQDSGLEQGKEPSGVRLLVRTGNFDLYNEDFKWVSEGKIKKRGLPPDIWFVERLEWGPFVGFVEKLTLNGRELKGEEVSPEFLRNAQEEGARRRERMRGLERKGLSRVNQEMEKERLLLKRAARIYGEGTQEYARQKRRYEWLMETLSARYKELEGELERLRAEDSRTTISLITGDGKRKTLRLSEVVRMYRPNELDLLARLKVYGSRWWEFLTQEPREANTEGGIMPAIFGTFVMTVIMSLLVAPFGVVAALFLREYARQGFLVSAIRIAVNNLAGVPSIVYGVFGLGFFAYTIGGRIDSLFYSERLPNPTFGTGGLLWSSLTLALLTVPVVIVATEEALAAVPSSMREGSLACGASKWQTVRYIVIPRAMPGILTGLILAMARGAGEVAPLMLVGVVKMAPELPVDGTFPYIHLERSFMHLAFHIFDLGFQSRNSEAAKPMVFASTLVLVGLVAVMNMVAVIIRNKLRKKFAEGHF